MKDKHCSKWPQHTHKCTHTQTQTHSNLNYGCKLGGGGDTGGGWWRLKWKSRTDQYCWRFSSLHSPLNCHAHSKQLKALCLSTSIPVLSFTSPPFSLALRFLTAPPCHFFLSHFLQVLSQCLSVSLLPFFIPSAVHRHTSKHVLDCTTVRHVK